MRASVPRIVADKESEEVRALIRSTEWTTRRDATAQKPIWLFLSLLLPGA